MADPITEFKGGNRFLSNFYLSNALMGGLSFPSVEHAYQAAKTFDRDMRFLIAQAPSPGQAKRMGQKVILRSDWEGVKLGIMLKLVKQKFITDNVLREQLLATGESELIEGNTWGDTFWGVCKGVGENHLGKILMQVRMALRGGNDG